MTTPTGAAEVYSALITEQLDEERARKTSLEQRGAFVITSSGAIATLLFGLAAFVTDAATLDLPPRAQQVLVVALICFAAAALFGLLTNRPVNYGEPTADSLQEMIDDPELASESITEAIRTASDGRLQTLRTYRQQNAKKAILASCALAAEVLGAVSVAYVVFRVLER